MTKLTQTRSMRPIILPSNSPATQPIPPITQSIPHRRRMGWMGWGVISVVALVALWWGSRSDASVVCPGTIQSSGAKNPLHGLRWHKETWDGQIKRRLQAGSYTYLQVSLQQPSMPAKQLSQWFVVMGKGQARKSRVKMTSYGTRSPFYSRRLQKCFPILYFGRITSSRP